MKLQFEKCDSTIVSNCKSEEEISQWLKRKFIVILENQTRFDNVNYEKDESYQKGRIVEESKIKWVGISSTQRQELANNLKITDVELQDSQIISLNEITLTNITIFTTE